MRMYDRYNDYYEDFLTYSPFSDSDVYDWRPGVHGELIVYLNNGTTLSYNCIKHTCRYLTRKRPEDEDNRDVGVTISVNIRRILDARRMTQKALADETGLSQTTINKYFNGQAQPTLGNAIKIAKALDCTLYDIAYFE